MLKTILLVTLFLTAAWLHAQDAALHYTWQGEVPEDNASEKTRTSSEKGFSGHALKMDMGIIGIIGDSIPGGGYGFSLRLAWQKSLDQKQRLRFNVSLAMGDVAGPSYTIIFWPYDVERAYLRSSVLQTGLHYDLFKWGGFSIVTAGNVSLRYVRGMSFYRSRPNDPLDVDVLNLVYPTAGFSVGFRLDPRQSPLAYELNLVSLAFGRDQARFRRLSFGLAYQFQKKK